MLLLARTFPFFGNLPDTIIGAWGNISVAISVQGTNSDVAISFAKAGPTRSITVSRDGWNAIDQILDYRINSGSYVNIPNASGTITGLASGNTIGFRFQDNGATGGTWPVRTITLTDTLTGIVIDTFTVDGT